MERMRANKLNYQEADCIRQMANIASGSLKNIDAYERVYQVSIHDELTGLYNRTYCGDACIMRALSEKREASCIWIWTILNCIMICTESRPETGSKNGVQKKLQENAENGKVFRVGSNEFLISVPETGSKTLVALAEKLTLQCRRMAWTNHWSCSRSPSVSAWHGIPTGVGCTGSFQKV